MSIIDDIIWLDTIVEKLAWKHRVFTSEVEEVLTGQRRIYRKEAGNVDGEHLSLWAKRVLEGISQFSSLRN